MKLKKKLTKKQASTLRAVWIGLYVGICLISILCMWISPETKTVAKTVAVSMLCMFFPVLGVIQYFDPNMHPKTRGLRALYWVALAAALLFSVWWYFISAPI